MKWLARLKKIEIVPQQDATKPTKPGYVGFVAPDIAPMQKITGDLSAANDSAPDPDGWCWPQSGAMNTREIDIFTARVLRFTAKELGLDDAEALADKLLKRDRDLDERRLCLECINLIRPRSAWSCTKWRAAGLGEIRVPSDLMQLLQRCDAFNAFDHGHQSFW